MIKTKSTSHTILSIQKYKTLLFFIIKLYKNKVKFPIISKIDLYYLHLQLFPVNIYLSHIVNNWELNHLQQKYNKLMFTVYHTSRV